MLSARRSTGAAAEAEPKRAGLGDLSSTMVGFLCVIAAAISPDKVFLFLLNSSGAIILFVYLLICLPQLRMRRMVPPEKLIVKMWALPGADHPTALAIVAVLIAMGLGAEADPSWCSACSPGRWFWSCTRCAGASSGMRHLRPQCRGGQSADPWMHEHISGAEVEVDAAVGEGPLSPELIRRAREEGYANEAP